MEVTNFRLWIRGCGWAFVKGLSPSLVAVAHFKHHTCSSEGPEISSKTDAFFRLCTHIKPRKPRKVFIHHQPNHLMSRQTVVQDSQLWPNSTWVHSDHYGSTDKESRTFSVLSWVRFPVVPFHNYTQYFKSMNHYRAETYGTKSWTITGVKILSHLLRGKYAVNYTNLLNYSMTRNRSILVS